MGTGAIQEAGFNDPGRLIRTRAEEDSIVTDTTIIELTADIVSAHVSNNATASSDVPALIKSVFDALSKTGEPLAAATARQEPAVSVRSSIKPDYLICLEDGAKMKMLKRYLRTHFDMSPGEYRTKWHLPPDYPMVAPNYAETRRSLAVKIGLGRKPRSVPADAGATVAHENPAKSTPAARKRLGIAQAKQAAQDHLGGSTTDQAGG